jgi:hypothetical protein
MKDDLYDMRKEVMPVDKLTWAGNVCLVIYRAGSGLVPVLSSSANL